MVPFDELEYKEYMDTVVRDWLKTCVTGGHISSYDGRRIHYYQAIHPQARAAIMMVHGFCEFFGKYHELAYDFYDRGYSIFFIELRGHGRSWRSLSQLDLVDVMDFTEYVEDLNSLVRQIYLPRTQGLKHYLYAHSMGGAVGALYLEKYPEVFDAAILSSPMLKLGMDGAALMKTKMALEMMHVSRKDTQPFPGSTPFDGKPDFENSAAASPARYEYQFRLRTDPRSLERYTMNGGSCRWLRAALIATDKLQKDAGKVTVPVLICQAGNDTFVDNAGQNSFAAKASDVRIVRFPQAKHELFYSCGQTLADYYNSLMSFLDEQNDEA